MENRTNPFKTRREVESIAPGDETDYESNIESGGWVNGYLEAQEDLKKSLFTFDEVVTFTSSMISQYKSGNTNIEQKALIEESLLSVKAPFEFPQKMELALDHLIKYCRRLELETPGKGYEVLQEIAPSTSIYDGVMKCLKYPEAEYVFVKSVAPPVLCKTNGCENRPVVGGNGLCEKCKQAHDDLPF